MAATMAKPLNDRSTPTPNTDQNVHGLPEASTGSDWIKHVLGAAYGDERSLNDLLGCPPDSLETDIEDPITIKHELDLSALGEYIDLAKCIKIEGTAEESAAILSVCEEYRDVFHKVIPPQPARVAPLVMEVNDDAWGQHYQERCPPRPMTPEKARDLKPMIDELVRIGAIRPSSAIAWSQCLLSRKPNGKWRFTIDYRRLNEHTRALGWPLPNIADVIQRIGDRKPKWFGVMDLTQGFHQAPMHDDSMKYTAFICYLGLYEWTRCPMGIKGGPSYFQREISLAFSKLLYTKMDLYIDDIIIW
jgi:hypothetical protein